MNRKGQLRMVGCDEIYFADGNAAVRVAGMAGLVRVPAVANADQVPQDEVFVESTRGMFVPADIAQVLFSTGAIDADSGV